MLPLTLLAAPVAALAIHPGDVVRHVDNPWFPLRPGSTYRYRGTDGGRPFRDVVHVTHRVKRILGAPATVVHDRVLTARGRVTENTYDFYAQDRRGTVWYLGENTAELDRHGHVKTREGTWRAGRHGARAGIFMPAHPRVGRAYRQEFLARHAEDHFRIARRGARVRTPYTSSRHALVTHEWSPLEPGVLDQKVYVRGIGDVKEASLKGGSEFLALVSYTR